AMATELRVLALQSPQIIINALAPRFERESGYRIIQLLDPAELPVHAKQKIEAGERFDAAFVEETVLEQLITERKLVAATRRNFIRVPIGVAVKAGAAKPDIGSVAVFRQTVLDAKSIAYLKTGRSGPYLDELFARWG